MSESFQFQAYASLDEYLSSNAENENYAIEVLFNPYPIAFGSHAEVLVMDDVQERWGRGDTIEHAIAHFLSDKAEYHPCVITFA